MTECFQAKDGTGVPSCDGSVSGSTRSPKCINCTNVGVRLRTPDDGHKVCSATCRFVIAIKLELSASVGFIQKEYITIQDHVILNKILHNHYLRHFCENYFVGKLR